MRTAIVLAAGYGSRLAPRAESIKPLTPVAGVPLIFRTLRSLSLAGCERVIVVIGHRGEEVRDAIAGKPENLPPVDFVVNEEYHLQNGVSVLAARARVDDPFVLTMADHVFSDDVMQSIRDHAPPRAGASLVVDPRIDRIFDLEDATKVCTENGRVVTIGKQLADFDAIDTGLFIATHGLMDALARIREVRGDVSLSEGVQALADSSRMQALDVRNGLWQDVDTPAMLAEAERLFAAGQR